MDKRACIHGILYIRVFAFVSIVRNCYLDATQHSLSVPVIKKMLLRWAYVISFWLSVIQIKTWISIKQNVKTTAHMHTMNS